MSPVRSPENRPPAPGTGSWFGLSISTKIIMPYLVLTIAVAIVGIYVVAWLVAGSLQERLQNQLLDSGNAASDSLVRHEQIHLEALRSVAFTEGVAEALEAEDRGELDRLVRPIVISKRMDSVEIADSQGREVLGLFRNPNARDVREYDWRANSDLTSWEAVRKVLEGYTDEYGDKLVFLGENADYGLMYYTVGPVKTRDGRLIGVALVGSYVNDMAVRVREETLADVTFYGPDGRVIASTLGNDAATLRHLTLTPAFYQSVLASQDSTQSREIDISGRPFRLAFGPWRMRQSVIGVYSVALPLNFIAQKTSTSRDMFAAIFTLATLMVVALGYGVSRLIVKPIRRLAQTSQAIASGDLQQQTGIKTGDEIGKLANSFDRMTVSLRERTQQLMEEASKTRAILTSIADGVLVLDTDGNIIASNKEGERFLDEMFRQALAVRFSETQGSVDELGVMKSLLESLSTGELERRRRFEAGARVLDALAAPVITAEGETIGTVLVLRDMTREVEVDRLKDEFIANISHEFRTPLTAVKGYIDLLSMTSRDGMSEQQRSFIHLADNNTRRLISMINELLDFSQIDAGTFGLIVEPLSLTDLVSRVAGEWLERMNAKGLSLEVYLPEEPLEIQGDEARLRWAITNLLSNSCNYTLPGGRVLISVGRVDGQVQISVMDTGIGISESDQKYLFTRFFRSSHEEVMKVRGSGLGLYAVKAVAEAHGGSVQINSELGRGSSFSIVLPENGVVERVSSFTPPVVGRFVP